MRWALSLLAVHESKRPSSLLMAVASEEEMVKAAIKAVQTDILWNNMIIMDQARLVAVNVLLFIRESIQGDIS